MPEQISTASVVMAKIQMAKIHNQLPRAAPFKLNRLKSKKILSAREFISVL
jgi:hypothetical protein